MKSKIDYDLDPCPDFYMRRAYQLQMLGHHEDEDQEELARKMWRKSNGK